MHVEAKKLRKFQNIEKRLYKYEAGRAVEVVGSISSRGNEYTQCLQNLAEVECLNSSLWFWLGLFLSCYMRDTVRS